jgi:coproporphyrinogen III oxidase-like Fe-S oxidoreductase
MLNALRLYQPITFDLFQKRTGFTIGAIEKQLSQAQKLGLINLSSDEIITTEHGKNFLNDLLEIFL